MQQEQHDQNDQSLFRHQQNQFLDCSQQAPPTTLPGVSPSRFQSSAVATSTAAINVNYYATHAGECNQNTFYSSNNNNDNHQHHNRQYRASQHSWQQTNCATHVICPNEHVELSIESNLNKQWIFDSSSSKQIIFRHKESTISLGQKQNSSNAILTTAQHTTNERTYATDSSYDYTNDNLQLTPPERMIQRVKANKKERRRTQSINQAFNKLRNHIPDVPSDTKLSKIKTLRLAISYISHLISILNNDQEPSLTNQSNSVISTNLSNKSDSGYKTNAEMKFSNISENRTRAGISCKKLNIDRNSMITKCEKSTGKHKKHRTGWPEIIWRSTNSLRKIETIQRVEL